jgi:hypothetical protein
LLLCSSYLPLGVPNWTVIYIINRAASGKRKEEEAAVVEEKNW